jgi:nucleoid-associated protein YgaU/cytochrome c-type biogenesis protein CcmH/NrfG
MVYKISTFLFIFSSSVGWSAPLNSRLIEAQAYLYRKEFSLAEEAFRLAQSGAGDWREATLGLATALQGQGKNDQSRELLGALLKDNPLDVEGIFLLAEIYLAEGKPDMARKELTRIRVLRPNLEGLEERLADVSLRLGETEFAKQEYERLLKKKQLSSRGILQLARLRISSGELEGAHELIESFESQFSMSLEAFLIKAEYLVLVNRKPEAEVAFRRGIQFGERNPESWKGYARFLLEERRFAEAQKMWENVVALDPQNWTFRHALGEAFELGDNLVAARKAYNYALALAPGEDQIMFSLVRVEEKAGAMDRVGARLQAWVKEYPQKTWVALSYARLLLAIGQRDRAREVAKVARKSNPDAPELKDFEQIVSDESFSMPKELVEQNRVAAIRREASVVREVDGGATLEPQPKEREHIVRKGDFLGTISTKFYGTSRLWKKILDANRDRMRRPEDLRPGLRLRIPSLEGQRKTEDSPLGSRIRPVQPIETIYVVKRRETLSSISKKLYGSTKHWRKIYEANRKKLRSPRSVYAGLKLTVPGLNPPPQVPESQPIVAAVVEDLAVPAEVSDLVVEDTLAFQSAAPSRRNASLLVTPNSVRLPELNKSAPDENEEKADALPFEVPEVKGGFQFSAMAGPLRESIRLNASGFSSNLPAKLGFMVGAEAGYSFEASPWELASRVVYSQTTFDGLLGVSPTKIQVDRMRLALLTKMASGWDPLVFRIGYEIGTRDVRETVPRVVVTNREQAGLLLGANLRQRIGLSYVGMGDFEVFLPHRTREKSTTTGFHTSSLSLELGAGIGRRFGKSTEASLGLKARMEMSSFDGTGSRGSSNGRERELLVTLPLEVRF